MAMDLIKLTVTQTDINANNPVTHQYIVCLPSNDMIENLRNEL